MMKGPLGEDVDSDSDPPVTTFPNSVGLVSETPVIGKLFAFADIESRKRLRVDRRNELSLTRMGDSLQDQ